MSDAIHALGKISAVTAETTEKSKSYEHTNCRVEPETEERCFNELMNKVCTYICTCMYVIPF